MLQAAKQRFSPTETSSFIKFDSKLVRRGVDPPSVALTLPSLSYTSQNLHVVDHFLLVGMKKKTLLAA